MSQPASQPGLSVGGNIDIVLLLLMLPLSFIDLELTTELDILFQAHSQRLHK